MSILWPSACTTSIPPMATATCAPTIALDFTRCTSTFPNIMEHGDWPSLDRFLSTLVGLRKVVLGFKTKKHMSSFTQDVLERRLPRLHTRIEYTCAILLHPYEDSPYVPPKEPRLFIAADSRQAAEAGTSIVSTSALSHDSSLGSKSQPKLLYKFCE